MTNKKGKAKFKGKGVAQPGQRRNRVTNRAGFGGMPAGSQSGSGMATGFFAPLELNATTYYHAVSVGDRLYRSTYFADLGVPGTGNTLQVNIIEPIINAFFTERGGDKLDTVSKQNLIDQIFYSTDFLTNLKLKWQKAFLAPKTTRSDTAFAAMLDYATWESLMGLLERERVKIPVLAINLSELLTPVFQIGPGHISSRYRPSYLQIATPWRAYSGSVAGTTWPSEITAGMAGNLMDIAKLIMQEYDSKIFAQQSGISFVPFTRKLVEHINIFHPISNVGDIYSHGVPCRWRGADPGTYTEYSATMSSTYPLRYNPQYGVPSDWFSILALLQLASDGGVWKAQAASFSKLSMMVMDIQAGGSESEIDFATGCQGYYVMPQFYQIVQAMQKASGTVGADAYRAYIVSQGFKQITNVLPSATAWYRRFVAFMSNQNAMSKSLTLPLAGLRVFRDIAISPAPRAGSATAQIAQDISDAAHFSNSNLTWDFFNMNRNRNNRWNDARSQRNAGNMDVG